MTTPALPAARRKAETTPLRRLSRLVLVLGSAVALLSLLGPVWVVRLGLVVAVVAAVVACVATWRELSEDRHQHAREMLAASKASGAALTEERQLNATVVDTLTSRVTAAKTEIQHQQAHIVELTSSLVELTTTIGTLRAEVCTLRGDLAAAQGEVRQRESVIAALQETVRSREAELTALSEAAGQVRSIPRRVLAEHDETSSAQLAEELFPDRRRPSTAQLTGTAELPSHEVLLPNYEGERKLA